MNIIYFAQNHTKKEDKTNGCPKYKRDLNGKSWYTREKLNKNDEATIKNMGVLTIPHSTIFQTTNCIPVTPSELVDTNSVI